MVPILLLLLHFVLLLRQSLLLLRPQWDMLGTKKSFLRRIEQHGSGAALVALPLLTLLLYQPQSWLPILLSHSVWPQLFILWVAIGLLALLAARFQHFNSLAFSSRDANPADFGRHWPFWPYGILWLCELAYLALLFAALYILYPLLLILGPLLYVYWRNWQYYKMRPRSAQVLSFEPVAPGLYLLRLRLEQPSQTFPNTPPHIPMSFCMLQFPKQKGLPCWQQNEHPLSLLRSHAELEFALEMQGFLEYLPQSAFAGNIQVWGPYYDVQPDFLESVLRSGHVLYIGSHSGLIPLLHFLEYLEARNWPVEAAGLKIAVLHLEAQSAREFWQSRLKHWEHWENQGNSSHSRISVQIQKIATYSASTEGKSEILEQEICNYLRGLCRQWQFSPKELQQHCLYRGPYALRKLVEQCFEAQ